MRNKTVSAFISLAMLVSAVPSGAAPADSAAAADTAAEYVSEVISDTPIFAAEANKQPQYQTTKRIMERLNRGLIATYRTADSRSVFADEAGVYLSWRLLGDEDLTSQTFDIYRSTSENGTYTKIYTTSFSDSKFKNSTNYIDTAGTAGNYYKVVKSGASAAELAAEKAAKPGENHTAKGSEVGNGNSHKNSFTYVDIPIDRPDPVQRMGDGKTSNYYDGNAGANDASIADLDGDGDYEIVLKWDPQDSKDSAGADFTGNVYIDGYEIDPNNANADGTHRMWRIDMGKNVTAGAHYTQFMVYDFDGDGKAEIAMKTAPGTVDGKGRYVTEVGDTEAIRNTDNTKSYIGTSGRLKGKNPFTQFLTVFNGETGEALRTTEYIPYEMHSSTYWGDSGAKYNRSERYLAAVAYLDGVHPSIIMCRGYYGEAVVRAYNWDGSDLVMLWEHDGAKKGSASLYGQGNHNLSVADIDNDGKDEIVYGSAALDDNGVAMGNTYLGHGDALHVSDFNNDGKQEAFSVKEESGGYTKYAMDLRTVATGSHFWESGKITTSGDNGRGVMDNIDDAYAKTHPNALAIGWDSGHANAVDLNGDDVAAKPGLGSRSGCNFLIYWDDDLGREILDDTIIGKYDAANGWTKRFYSGDGYSLTGSSSNNDSKYTPSLAADIWGDWREEVIMGVNKHDSKQPAYLRIFTSTLPTTYRLTTLMHDSQYRMAIAWQNTGYNQPPHTSYYIGSAALATDASGNELNYLAPAVKYSNIAYELITVPVKGVTLDRQTMRVEKGRTAAIKANVTPSDASKKGVSWTSSNPAVASVNNGIITGVSEGSATITAVTKDGGYTAECEVTVYQTHVTGIAVEPTSMQVGVGYTKQIKAVLSPEDATDKSVKWSTSDYTIATVDEYGTVTGIKEGAVYITATANDGAKTAQCVVNVLPLTITDETNGNAFESVGASAETVIDTTATSASITHTNAADGALASKTMTAFSDARQTVSFKFVTGGQKDASGAWSWTGREYTLKLSFLDPNGNNILELAQSYGDGSNGGAGKLTSRIHDLAAENVESTWTNTELGNIQGSAKRWIVNIEFDYDNNICTPIIIGCDSSWSETGRAVCDPFELDGAQFATIRVSTEKTGSGAISAAPSLSELKYERTTVMVNGELPTPGPVVTPPPPATPKPTAAPTPTPVPVVNTVSTSDFNAVERVTVSDNEGETVFTMASKANNARGRAYADISALVAGETSYTVLYDSYLPGSSRARIALVDTSKRPGGSNKTTYDKAGVAFSQGVTDSSSYALNEDKSIYGIPAARDQYVHTRLDVDTQSKTIEFKITDADGNVMKSGSASYLSEDITVIDGIELLDTINDSVCKMKNVQVITYKPAETGIHLELKSVDGNEAAAEITGSAENGAALIGALYNENGTLEEIKAVPAVSGETTLTFDNVVNSYELKLMLWESLDNMKALDAVINWKNGEILTQQTPAL